MRKIADQLDPMRSWRHVVDLSRPRRNLAADIDALAESVDTARSRTAT
ncbi:hypothetical protein AB0A94_35980 [Streptomyces sp. NPDC044984]